jgi:hypothetical protein
MPYADLDRARDYQREYRRIRRAGDDCTTPGTSLVPLPFRLQTAADVLTMLEDQATAVVDDADASALEKARVVGFLCGVALKAIESGSMAARVEALEAALKLRNGVHKK